MKRSWAKYRLRVKYVRGVVVIYEFRGHFFYIRLGNGRSGRRGKKAQYTGTRWQCDCADTAETSAKEFPGRRIVRTLKRIRKATAKIRGTADRTSESNGTWPKDDSLMRMTFFLFFSPIFRNILNVTIWCSIKKNIFFYTLGLPNDLNWNAVLQLLRVKISSTNWMRVCIWSISNDLFL